MKYCQMFSLVFCFCFALACNAQDRPAKKTETVPPVPERKTTAIHGDAPVAAIELTFMRGEEVSARVINIQYGTPTSAIVLNRDIRVEGINAQGHVLHALSIEDPRVVHEDEADEKDGQHAVMPEGKQIVFLPYSDELSAVLITGQAPGLESLKSRLDISGPLKEAYRQFRG